MNVMVEIGNRDRYVDYIISAIGLDGRDRLSMARFKDLRKKPGFCVNISVRFMILRRNRVFGPSVQERFLKCDLFLDKGILPQFTLMFYNLR